MKALMVTNRNLARNGLGNKRDSLRYFASDRSELSSLRDWKEVEASQFRDLIRGIVDGFPLVGEEANEQQRHLSLFIHGYNNDWKEAVQRYRQIQSSLYGEDNGLGQLVLFTWPSNGEVFAYLPDREDARTSAPDLAQVFVKLHDDITTIQRASSIRGGHATPCRAKVSVIAHSMGNYVLQKALASASKTLNNPQLVTLIHQCVMVAADVDNDLFQRTQPEDADGALMANLCYRIGALYTGLDQVLGASAGLKHFGKRRLGRSGLARREDVHDNVFDWDVTSLLESEPRNVHSAVFDTPAAMGLLRRILVGNDRRLLVEAP